ncbi:hypothetical protein [Gordonibacter massiliensis (ex Traore et al. 2017)]|uniref:Tetracyclin repressor-like C-terminal domain-containing protein n=1 Tax=Gordonibacter massiliensis (ex Traore et al. 2017) TaxID=1841863 RepID=A0A842JB43_9ACTN|nr:hypothetical protein [Gordonibacter massiliensis (ex Traore et al. 2017)]MBC2888947.1 hypothetical protein [Gordonibacter massiliensis (ex Traore et al. 2017)]
MEFKRARTEEQKRQRLEGIVRTVDDLLDRYPYREITMAMVADELGFSRANLGHYVKTKEEMFLLLYLHDLEGLHAELAQMTASDDRVVAEDGDAVGRGIEELSGRLAAACARHRNVGRIGALLSAIIETNIDVDRLTACKRTMRELAEDGARLLAARFPFLASGDAAELVMVLVNHVAGLYPGTHPVTIQQEALRRASFEDAARDFESALRRFLVVQLNGYRALSQRS